MLPGMADHCSAEIENFFCMLIYELLLDSNKTKVGTVFVPF